MYSAVLRGCRRADAANLAARERRLQNVGGVERPLSRAGADQGVQLVDEHDDVRVLGELLHDRLQALLELTAVLRARDDQRDVERQNALVTEEVRHVAADDLLREPFDDGRLADARLADEHRVVLRAAAQHLLDALELDVTADERVELVLHRGFGQIATEFGEERRLLRTRRRRLLVQELDDVLPHAREPHPLFVQDGRRDRPLFPENPEEQVFGPDVGMEQPVRFFGGELQHPLRLGAEGDLDRGGDLLPENRPAFDLFPNAFEGEVRSREDPAREALAFADQSEKEMLGLN